MAAYRDGPYRPQDHQAVAEVMRGMEASNAKGRRSFRAKKSTFGVAGSTIKVDSWRMQEWDYKRPDLPTYARGLFTTRDSKGRHEIAVRGYDKFFNCGEVRETEWRNIETSTRGPYELSVKENGCIIFIAGLEDEILIVCSKHSTGARHDTDLSHAQAGERWVEKHLATMGKTKADLARTLRQMNATAVAELCDDEFEEHVLAYTPETAGLYLHGLNLNLPEFATYPHHLVDQFATDWGFKTTQYLIKDTIEEVKEFLDGIAETGAYNGRDTEGFVIRCQSNANTGIWHDWFFKYKFEEPYLMYRQWRECTKSAISGREPRIKKHKKITEEYLAFARRQLHANKALAKAYMNNHGIIELRDAFLASTGMKGSDIIRQENESGEAGSAAIRQDVILVPVATIGCGKTTVALALSRLFNWGHIQNDNIVAKSKKPQAFANACVHSLTQDRAVIADRNNHQRREREQLITDMSKIIPSATFVALHFVHDQGNFDNIRHTLRERVLTRGDNHQTIHTSKGSDEIISIMEGFMRRFEPVNVESAPDDAFDLVIDLDPISGSRENLETVITKLYIEYPHLFDGQEMPTSEEMDAAIAKAMNDYQVDLKHEIKSRDNHNTKLAKKQQLQASNQDATTSRPKEKRIEYFAAQLAPTRVNAILEAMFRDLSPPTSKFYLTLKQQRRVQPEFHVTLIHRASASQHPETWTRLSDLYAAASAPTPDRAYALPEAKLGLCHVRLERLVWDARIMAFVVRLSPVEGNEVFNSVNAVAHVTVGTASPDVKPKESNDLLVRWMEVGSGGDTGIGEVPVKGSVVLDGVVRGILAR